jgi:hypothetical protein
MKDLWLRIGCFFTGHNYILIDTCSEASKKAVKKYLAALILVMMIWGFIGFSFSQRYLGLSGLGSMLGALVGVIIVVQIERQIIMAVSPNSVVKNLRILIAVIMSLIGALIVDQIIFKNDLEQVRRDFLQEKVALRATNIENKYKSIKDKKRSLKNNLLSDINNTNSKIKETGGSVLRGKNTERTSKLNIDSSITYGRKSDETFMANPLLNQLQMYQFEHSKLINSEIEDDKQKATEISLLESSILNEKIGFIDELKLMFRRLIFSSVESFIFWLLWIALLLGIELFILFSKLHDGKTDYDNLVAYQMNIREERLKVILRKQTAEFGSTEDMNNSNEILNRKP